MIGALSQCSSFVKSGLETGELGRDTYSAGDGNPQI